MGKMIVVSAINIVDGGALTVLEDALTAFEQNFQPGEQIVFLVSSEKVHSKVLCKHIKFEYFPKSKRSWLYRLFYEYIYFLYFSYKTKPDIWLSLHDTSPNVISKIKYVYCHNPSIFLNFPLKDIKLDFKQFLFSKFYKYLYKINIKKNNYVITQQAWIAREFSKIFNLEKFIVAEPDTHPPEESDALSSSNSDNIFTLFYPAYPRYFKNHEVIYKASLKTPDCKFILTIKGNETKYIRHVKKSYFTPNIEHIGLIPRSQVYFHYKQCDALVFPSLLETWGLPLTEFKKFEKPIIAANLPYAHETLGSYPFTYWFDPHSAESLIRAIERAKSNLAPDNPVVVECEFLKVSGWDSLVKLIKKEANHG